MTTENQTSKLQLTYGKGYTGKTGNKCWVAAITGSDNQYGLTREFVEASKVEREHFNRPRTTITFTYDLEIGLYERSEHGVRCFFLVFPAKDGAVKRCQINDDRVEAMVALMDDGLSAEDARKATKPAPATTEAAK